MEVIKEQKLEENLDKKGKIEIEKEKEIISNNKTNKGTQIFENINSPLKIQRFLQLSTYSTKKGLELEKNIIQSLLSINNIIIDIFDDDIGQNTFNPIILTQNKKNDLYKLNFEEINITNNFLNQNIKQYNELKEKISEYNSLKSDEKTEKPEKSEDNSGKSEKKEGKINKNIKKNLYFIQHPLITIFEEEKKINIKQLKNEINNEYLNKMKDNTNYKNIGHLINLQMILNALNENNNNNENNANMANNDEDNRDDNEDEGEDDENLHFYEHFYSSNSSSHENNENVNNAPNNIQNQNVPIELENINQNNDNIQAIQIINPNEINNDQNNINVQNNENEQNNA